MWVDGWVERTLLARSVVSKEAIAHARAVQERGYEGSRLEELLVELGYVSSEALAQVFAEALGTQVWKGEDLDTDVSKTLGSRRAVVVRREGRSVVYATTAPYDEGLRDQARFSVDAAHAAAWVTTEATIDDVRWRCRSDADAYEPHAGSEPDALERLANLLLLEHVIGVPGHCVRVRAFEEGFLDRGRFGIFEGPILGGWETLPDPLLERLCDRFRFMTLGELGPAGDLDGWIMLVTGAQGRSYGVRVYDRTTTLGRATVLVRQARFWGYRPNGAEWEPWRQRVAELGRTTGDERLRAAQAVVAAADELGEEARLEQVACRQDQAAFLLQSERYSEARSVVREARALARFGPHVDAQLLALEGETTVDDLAGRIRLLEQAASLSSAVGVGREPAAHVLRALGYTHGVAGNAREGVRLSRAAVADDEAWFGAITEIGMHALIDEALAQCSLEDFDAARRCAERAAAAASAIGLSLLPSAWVRARIARLTGDAPRARAELEQALSNAAEGEDVAMARAELALAHDAAGDLAEARRLASESLAMLSSAGALAPPLLRELEAVLHRAGPYR